MSNDPNEIRNDIEHTRRELGQDVDALADKVTPSKIAQRQTDKVKNALFGVKDRVMGKAEDVRDAAMDAADSAGDAVTDAPHRMAQTTRGNPMAVGLIAFGIGWLASSLIPASTVERKAGEKVKEAAAPLTHELGDVAKEAADHLRQPAQEAMDSVKGAATDAVETVKEEGADAAQSLKSDAQDAKHTVQNDM
jgi:gas vesicle protein